MKLTDTRTLNIDEAKQRALELEALYRYWQSRKHELRAHCPHDKHEKQPIPGCADNYYQCGICGKIWEEFEGVLGRN